MKQKILYIIQSLTYIQTQNIIIFKELTSKILNFTIFIFIFLIFFLYFFIFFFNLINIYLFLDYAPINITKLKYIYNSNILKIIYLFFVLILTIILEYTFILILLHIQNYLKQFINDYFKNFKIFSFFIYFILNLNIFILIINIYLNFTNFFIFIDKFIKISYYILILREISTDFYIG